MHYIRENDEKDILVSFTVTGNAFKLATAAKLPCIKAC